MRIAFFDLETTGIPIQPGYNKFYSYDQLKYYDNARIVQIALITYDFDEKEQTFKKIAEYDYIIKPDGFKISNADIHNIPHSMAVFAGLDFVEVMTIIIPALAECDLLVAHNSKFDRNVLLSELYRYQLHSSIDIVSSMADFCTCDNSVNITKLPFNYKKYKHPKLNELHKYLFGVDAKDLHNALNDTRVTVKCFIELYSRGLISF